MSTDPLTPDELAAIREQHRPFPFDVQQVCIADGVIPWPCAAARLLAEVERLRAEREEMIQGMRRAMDDMGTSSLSHHILRPYVGWERKN